MYRIVDTPLVLRFWNVLHFCIDVGFEYARSVPSNVLCATVSVHVACHVPFVWVCLKQVPQLQQSITIFPSIAGQGSGMCRCAKEVGNDARYLSGVKNWCFWCFASM